MMAKDPADRYQTPGEVAQACSSRLRPRPRFRPPRRSRSLPWQAQSPSPTGGAEDCGRWRGLRRRVPRPCREAQHPSPGNLGPIAALGRRNKRDLRRRRYGASRTESAPSSKSALCPIGRAGWSAARGLGPSRPGSSAFLGLVPVEFACLSAQPHSALVCPITVRARPIEVFSFPAVTGLLTASTQVSLPLSIRWGAFSGFSSG